MNTIEQLKIDKQLVEQKIASELLSLSEKYGGLSIDVNVSNFELKDVYSKEKSIMFNVELEIKL